MLVEAFPAGRRAGLVDGVGGDDLLEDLGALLGDRLLVQSARDRLVDLDRHCLTSRSKAGGSRTPPLALSPPSTGIVAPVM
jgi:hypothetical protein